MAKRPYDVVADTAPVGTIRKAIKNMAKPKYIRPSFDADPMSRDGLPGSGGDYDWPGEANGGFAAPLPKGTEWPLSPGFTMMGDNYNPPYPELADPQDWNGDGKFDARSRSTQARKPFRGKVK